MFLCSCEEALLILEKNAQDPRLVGQSTSISNLGRVLHITSTVDINQVYPL